MLTKQEIRTQIRKKRISLTEEELKLKNHAITNSVLHNDEFLKATTILLYHSINNEVDTTRIFDTALSLGIRVGFPRVIGNTMRFFHVQNEDDLELGYMGIKEPIPEKTIPIDPVDGLIIVPGIAFDEKGNRTGYGRGYYDRYLAEHPFLITMGLSYDFQVYKEIEKESHDIPLKYIITESRVIINEF